MALLAGVYWWVGRKNFGDALTPFLLARFGLNVVWAPAAEARAVAVGSVLEHLPRRWGGVVAGAGKLMEHSPVDLSGVTVLALRGPLSARGVRGDFALGDPGLLADHLVPLPAKRHQLGIVAHWSDRELVRRPEFARYDPLIIDVTGHPVEVVRQIGSCRKIVSSSLHGLVVADAFGIPRRFERAASFARPRQGGDFKFRDHAAAIGLPFEVGVTASANRSKIDDRQSELYDVLTALGQAVMG